LAVQGHLAEATRHLERAIQIDPSDQEARAYLERITQGYK